MLNMQMLYKLNPKSNYAVMFPMKDIMASPPRVLARISLAKLVVCIMLASMMLPVSVDAKKNEMSDAQVAHAMIAPAATVLTKGMHVYAQYGAGGLFHPGTVRSTEVNAAGNVEAMITFLDGDTRHNRVNLDQVRVRNNLVSYDNFDGDGPGTAAATALKFSKAAGGGGGGGSSAGKRAASTKSSQKEPAVKKQCTALVGGGGGGGASSAAGGAARGNAAEARANAAEARAKAAEARAKAAEARAKAAEARAEASKKRAEEAEKRAEEAEQREADAEAAKKSAQALATQNEVRASDANLRATAAEARVVEAMKRAEEAEKMLQQAARTTTTARDGAASSAAFPSTPNPAGGAGGFDSAGPHGGSAGNHTRTRTPTQRFVADNTNAGAWKNTDHTK